MSEAIAELKPYTDLSYNLNSSPVCIVLLKMLTNVAVFVLIVAETCPKTCHT